MNATNILIVDDHPVTLAGMQAILRNSKCYQNCRFTFAKNGMDAFNEYEKEKPDLIITDVRMPRIDGLRFVQAIRKKDEYTPILIISVLSSMATVTRALELGVNGYLTKKAEKSEIIHATQLLLSGKNYFSSEISQLYLKSRGRSTKSQLRIVLTDRELEVLQLISKDYSQEEMAHELNISRRTIEGHARNLRNKLKAKSAAGMITLAFQQGLLE